MMNNMTRIRMIVWVGALIAMSSCNKHRPADEVDQGVPMVFSAVSQTTPMKAGSEAGFPYEDFGIWGMARKAGHEDYVLWTADAMTKVAKSGTSYVPASNAYWFSGFEYNFIGIAPFDPSISGGAATEFAFQQAAGEQKDAVSFTYNMTTHYASTDYDFDLMGAVAQTLCAQASGQSAQPLKFYHLLAQVNIQVKFVDAGGNPSAGSVQAMRLCRVDAVSRYTISRGNSDYPPTVTFALPQEADRVQSQIDFVAEAGTDFVSAPATVHILPQNITGLELYLDFTLGQGDNAIAFTDFKANLNANPAVYEPNKVYNWTLAIGPKGAISFKVDVEPWTREQVGGDIDIY